MKWDEIGVWSCGIWFPDQGSNTRTLHWDRGVLTTGPTTSEVPQGYWFYRQYFFLKLFIYLFLTVLSLHCFVWAFSTCRARATLCLWFTDSSRWLLLCRVLEDIGFSTCGAQVQLLSSLWDLPEPGIELVSPAFQGRFLTTWPPGKHPYWNF